MSHWMYTLLIMWAVPTVVLIFLLIYKSTLTMHEDDQLFLDDAESALAQEQAELMQRMDKIQPYIRGLGVVSGVLIVMIFGLWIYDGISRM
jgi:Tfp pilus assembly protein PilN